MKGSNLMHTKKSCTSQMLITHQMCAHQTAPKNALVLMMDILNTSTKILFNIVQVNVCPCYLLKSTVVCLKIILINRLHIQYIVCILLGYFSSSCAPKWRVHR